MAQIRAAHPDWLGRTAALAWPSQLFTYSSRDVRAQLLADLGFSVPDTIDNRAGDTRFLSRRQTNM